VLHEIVSTALQVRDSGKLYNTMRRYMYDVDQDGSEEFASVWMIVSKMVMCDGCMMKGKEKG